MKALETSLEGEGIKFLFLSSHQKTLVESIGTLVCDASAENTEAYREALARINYLNRLQKK